MTAAANPPTAGAGDTQGTTGAGTSAPQNGEPAHRDGAGSAAESCPLCGAPLAADQDWCLRCGGAARTRLAASPRWTAPIVGVGVVAVLALGVLAASLVSLAGNSSSKTTPATTTVTIPAVTVTAPTVPPAGSSGATGATPNTGATAATGATSTTGVASPTGPTTRAGPTSASGVTPGTAGATSATGATRGLLSGAVSKRLRELEARRQGKAP